MNVSLLIEKGLWTQCKIQVEEHNILAVHHNLQMLYLQKYSFMVLGL